MRGGETRGRRRRPADPRRDRAEGLGDRIHLSHDAACFLDFRVGNPFFADEKPDHLLISNQVLPALRQEGVSQTQIDQMMVENPRRFLTGGGPSSGAGSPAESPAEATGAQATD